MKKFTLFLSTLLFSMMSFGAPLGEGYSKVTDITTLSAGDKVVLYCDDAELGVTGWNGNKDAIVAYTGWVEYVVEATEGGVYLKDEAIGKYVLPAEKAFKYDAIPSIACNVSSDGILYGVISDQNYYLYDNNGQYYRMYVDKTGNASYKPFYVYKVIGEGGGTTPDDGGETPDDGGETPEDTELVIPEEAKDWNIPAEAIDVLKAREICAGLASGEKSGTKYYVMGYVKKIHNKHVDGVTNFGNAQFYMENVKGANSADDFMAYQVYGLNGEKITDPNVVAVGDFVVVYGELTNYNGTYETVGKGAAHIWNSTNPLLSGETPDDGGETPDDGGETPEDGKVTFAAASDKGNSTSDSNNAAEYTITKNGVTMVVSQGVVTDHYRIYKNQTLTISAAGKTITSIEITCTVAGEEKYGPGCFVTETPTYTYSEKVGTWVGEATEVTFTASLNQVRATQIVVTVAETSEDFVATPTISGEADFLENTIVTITAEEGLEVYYTLDGTDPTKASNKYTAPFELTATTTVKAIAYDATKDKASAVVEKVFSKMTVLTCEEAVALCTNPATPGQHIIRGYITEVQEAYNEQYKNITFWMADAQDGENTLLAFRVKPVSDVEKTLKEGDFVEVIGSLILYSKDGVDTPEVNAGGSVKLITPGATAVDNVTVNQQTTKFIQNGQLVIVKDGVRYNVIGQVTK